MKKINVLILIIIAFVIFAIIAIGISLHKAKLKYKDDFVPRPGNVENIEFILFKNSFEHVSSNNIKPNAALLITDKEEIKEDQQLFLAPQHYLQMCGSDYTFQFWYNTDSLSDERDFNANCEVFSYKPKETYKRYDYYMQKLKTAPTHYIYNLELSAMTDPEDVKSVFKNSGLKLFFIDGTSRRFPSVTFSYCHFSYIGNLTSEEKERKAEDENEKEARNIFKKMINKVRSIAPVLKQSDVFFDTIGAVRDSAYHDGYVILRFKHGTDLNKVIHLLTNEGAKIDNVENPTKYYIQLIDPSSDIHKIRRKVMKYKIIKNVSEYSN